MDLKEQISFADRRKKPRTRIPQQTYPKGLERDYNRFLQSIVNLVRAAYKPVFAALPSALADATKTDSARMDAKKEDIVKMLKAAGKRLKESLNTKQMSDFLKKHARRVNDWNAKEFTKQARAALGVDIFFGNSRLEKQVDRHTKENVDLIKDIADQSRKRIDDRVQEALRVGTRHEVLARDLADGLAIDDRRAALIARDQVGKLYGQINADRQKDLGITKFIWRTSNDNRVRDEHEALADKEYSYDDPPDEGLPGEPIQCRCNAEPVFDFLR